MRLEGRPTEIGSGDTATICVNKKYKLYFTESPYGSRDGSREITAELIREDKKDD